MSTDPVLAYPELYRVVFENERVRVLEYADVPGESTQMHHHPDTVMVTLSDFTRRLSRGERSFDVDMRSGSVQWLDAQDHAGANIGTSDTHAIFVELKEDRPKRL